MKQVLVKLNDGTSIPQVGLGTWMLDNAKDVQIALNAAYNVGYRHIDTAQFYNNEYEIGNFLKANKIQRNDVYLTTKVWIANFNSESDFRKSVFQSLRRLGVNKVNLLLLHWAASEKISVRAYQWLEKMQDEGYTTSIGVSNFNIQRLETIIKIARHYPVVNQVQFDLINQQNKLRFFCHQHHIAVQGYSLLKPYLGISTRAHLSKSQQIKVDKIGQKHNKSGAQVILRYAFEKGLIIFPKSRSPQRIASNFDIFNFKLAPKDIQDLEAMHQDGPQKMDQVANGLWDHELKSPLLYEAKFKTTDQEDNRYINDKSIKIKR